MSGTTRSISPASAIALSLAVVGSLSAAAQGASINYGNFGPVPPGVSFLQVTESSATDPVPLYGSPTPYSSGLDFKPMAFVATTAGGGADVTDGQLNYALTAAGMGGISAISIFEAGDYTLAGVGATATSAFAGAIIRVTITQINTVPVAPINLLPVNVSVGFSLPGTSIVQPWSLGVLIDVGAQMAILGYPSGNVATKVEVVVNNSLVATSEPNSVAFIAKKEFRIDFISVEEIPEPCSTALAGLALCGLRLMGRHRN